MTCPDPGRATAHRVELLHHEGCPLAPTVRELVETCLREPGLDPTGAERAGRYPSPTVLIDGRDVTGASRLNADACRLDLPTRTDLLRALSTRPSGPH